ncbi:MAG: DUF4124 domain-containing protein [Gammaproteobacteria bacterium]
MSIVRIHYNKLPKEFWLLEVRERRLDTGFYATFLESELVVERELIMKFVFILLVILAAFGGYLYLHPDVWQDWAKGTPLEAEPAITHLYKWQDANGQWQVSDQPPAGDIEYKRLEYSSDTNVMPPVPTADDEE